MTATSTLTATQTVTFTPSATYTITPSPTPTATQTITFTASASRTATPTSTDTFTITVSYTASASPTPTFTWTDTFTQTVSYTASTTPTPSASSTDTFTQTITFTPSATYTATPSQTESFTQTVTYTPSTTYTATPTQTLTFTLTITATPSATYTVTPSQTLTSTLSATATSSVTYTITPSQTLTFTQTVTSTPTFTYTITPTQTLTSTLTVTATPSATYTPTPTQTATYSSSATLTLSPTITPSFSKTPTPLSPVFYASIKIYNSAGEVVDVIDDSRALPSSPLGLTVLQGNFDPDQNGLGQVMLNGANTLITWNGSSSAGQFVQSGTYTMKVEVKDGFGKVQSWSAAMTVMRSDTGVLVQVFNSAGEMVWSQSSNSGTAGSINLSDRQFVPSASGPGLKISYGTGSRDYVMWNGLNSQGQAVASGDYVVQITQGTETGKRVFTQSVTVLEEDGTVFGQAIAWPNPADSGISSITIWLAGLAPGSEAWGDVYNLAGERVGTLSPDPLGLRWDLPRGSASGIYLARINARDSQGHKQSQNLKLAVTH
jgi:hypothetical protein